MHCFCEQKETYELKVEGDVGADPVWCNMDQGTRAILFSR
jgi:hypothetical protein